jgi:DnaJ-class molecular chaperone
MTKEDSRQKTCEVCEGSGQVCSFKGVSRFALIWEDCPICGGMGFTLSPTEKDGQETDPDGEDDEK